MIKVKEVSELVLKPGDIVFDCHPGKYTTTAAGFEVEKIDSINNEVVLKGINKNAFKEYMPNYLTKIFTFSFREDRGWFLLDLIID